MSAEAQFKEDLMCYGCGKFGAFDFDSRKIC